MAVERLTQKAVDARQWAGTTEFIRDAEVKGLILAINKTSKTWKVQRDMWQDRKVRTVRHTLGTADELSLKDARARAKIVIGQIADGVNPNARPVPREAEGPHQWTVARLWDEYEAYMRARGREQRTIDGMRYQLGRYLADWRDTVIADLRKSTCRERHQFITRKHGPYPANQTMRSLRAAYNFAIKRDDEGLLPANPVGGVDFNPERRREAVILPEELADWAQRVAALPNPLRARMHMLGLFSGLRPGTLISIERDWIDLDGQAIRIPRMKSGRGFALPLSAHMVELVRETLDLSQKLFPTAPWLFPTRTNDGREVVCTRVWRERKMPSETGHILRHTYRTQAEAIGIPTNIARALLDHRAPGIEAHYVHPSGLAAELLNAQERMTEHLLKLTAK